MTTRRAWRGVGVYAMIAVAGCADGGDRCQGVLCDSPPVSACQDSVTRVTYLAPGSCQSETGECTYTSETNTCQQVCEAGVCDPDLGDDFAVLAREGARVCSQWSALGVRNSYAARAQIRFRPGLHRLPRDQTTFELDLVEELLLGPDGTPATPSGPGMVEATLNGTSTDGTYSYAFRRPYDTPLGAQDLEVITSFQVKGGEPASPIKVIDDLAQINENCWLDPGARLSGGEASTGFGTCQFDDPELFSSRVVEIAAENGDQVHCELRLSFKCCCLRPGDFADLVLLRYSRGGEIAEVTDFYRLAFSAVHHFFGQSLLAVFDTPIGNVAGVLIEGADAPEAASVTVSTLDANLKVLEILPVATIQIQE